MTPKVLERKPGLFSSFKHIPRHVSGWSARTPTNRLRAYAPPVGGVQSGALGVGLQKNSSAQATEKIIPDLDVSTGPFPESFELGEELGRGTFGIVFRAMDTATGENFAVKVLKKRSGPFMNLKRIRNEVLAWRELSAHDNAVGFHGCYEDKDNIYLVQELCTGGDLRDLFMSREGQFLEEVEVAQVASCILRIVAFCHEKSMCYGDIKPENFVLKYAYQEPQAEVLPDGPKGHMILKAVDFGSATMNVGNEKLRGEIGSPLYRAPEAHEGGYGLEVDVWSLGVLLYHLLCGRPPFVDRVISGEWEWSSNIGRKLQPDGLGFAITAIPLDFNGDKWATISENAKDLLSKMLERDVSKRITAEAALDHVWIKENLASLNLEDPVACFDKSDEEAFAA